MHGKTIDEMYIGQFALLKKTITDADVHIFAGVTGDMNPVHLDDLYASCSIFQQRIAHGGLVAGLFSTVLGTILPGLGTIYLSQTSKFVKPVFIVPKTVRSEEHTSELQSRPHLVCRLLLEKNKSI